MPVSRTVKCSCKVSPVLLIRARPSTATSPCSVNLMALPTRFTRICRSRSGSPHDAPRARPGAIVADQFQPLARAPAGPGSCSGVSRMSRRFEIDRFQVQLAGLDLGEIQNVVDDAEQGVGRDFDDLQVFALLGRQFGVQRQFRHADDAVHRGADFVAHVGQEFALGPVGSSAASCARLRAVMSAITPTSSRPPDAPVTIRTWLFIHRTSSVSGNHPMFELSAAGLPWRQCTMGFGERAVFRMNVICPEGWLGQPLFERITKKNFRLLVHKAELLRGEGCGAIR